MGFSLKSIFGGHDAGHELTCGMIDCHSHILPGVDDGVRTMEESLEILAEYERLGVEELWLTPHIMEEIPNTPEKLRGIFEELKAQYDGPIRLHLAAENMMDSALAKNLEKRTLLPLGEGADRLLIETSYFDRPSNFYDMIEEIMRLGLMPVLAHPERYNYMGPKDYETLKKMGVLFQLNLFSLTGYYGPMVEKKAQQLIADRAYDLAGSDLHSFRQLGRLRKLRPGLVAGKHRGYLEELVVSR